MEFIETSYFTRTLLSLGCEEEYRQLQKLLVDKPTLGRLIPHTGGLRKIRMSTPGIGKRGGARVIYFYPMKRSVVFMLACYAKSTKDDLTADEKKVLQRLTVRIKKFLEGGA